MAERWTWVPGLEGKYQVSSLGRVANNRGRVLKPYRGGTTSQCPYYKVNLWDGLGGRIAVYVHQLVAWAFLGDQPKGTQVHHKDGRWHNNAAHNLAYVDPAEHYASHRQGEANSQAILTEREVREIRRQLGKGARGTEVARKYGVAPQTIYSIKSGRTWAHVQ